MITIKQIKTLDDILAHWDLLLGDKPERYKTAEAFLCTLVTNLSNGLFLAFNNDVYAGFCMLARHGYKYTLCHLPSGPDQVGKQCFSQVRAWARKQKIRSIEVTTTKFSGATQKYFKGLGFNQKAVIYTTRT